MESKMVELIKEFGAEGTLIRLIAEMEAMTNLLPTDTVTSSGEAMFDRILPLLDQAMSLSGEWDAEVRSNGLNAGRLPDGGHIV